MRHRVSGMPAHRRTSERAAVAVPIAIVTPPLESVSIAALRRLSSSVAQEGCHQETEDQISACPITSPTDTQIDEILLDLPQADENYFAGRQR
jgi:hypothetical protein